MSKLENIIIKESFVKFTRVNLCETLEELSEVILSFGAENNGGIRGRVRIFDAVEQSNNCLHYSLEYPNTLTRNYGIRQQAMYILISEKREI